MSKQQRVDISAIDTQVIIELTERLGISGAAERLDCSRSGLTYQMEQRGIPRPANHTARSRRLLRQWALDRYGYGSDEELLEALRRLHKELGRRPRIDDLAEWPNLPSKGVFVNRFGSWTNALELAGIEQPPKRGRRRAASRKAPPLEDRVYKSMTPKLRFAVLDRDKFRCVYCGRSPRLYGIVLHVDHVTPVSKGGLTTYGNLVAACEECNQGKSNRQEESP